MSRGPILTLLAVLALGVALLGIDIAAEEPGPAATDVAASAPAASDPPPSSAAAPPPTAASIAPAAAGDQAPTNGPATEEKTTPFPPKATYVGEAATARGPIPLSVTVDGDRAKVYVCDNKKIEAWLQGTARDGLVEATGKRGARLSGRHQGNQLVGTVTIPGYPTWDVTATSTTNAKAGTYRASSSGRTSGWVVPDDTRRQVGLTHDERGALAPARPLDLDAPLPAGTTPVDATTDVLAGP